MKMTIDIEIPESLVQSVIGEIINNSFRIPQRYSDSPSIGYELVKNQTIEVIKTLDFKSDITVSINKHVKNGVIDEVTGQVLRNEIKKAIVAMKKNGEFFNTELFKGLTNGNE